MTALRAAFHIGHCKCEMNVVMDNAAKLYTRAVTYFNAKQFALAESACRKALQSKATHTEAQHLLGLTLVELERLDEAALCFQMALTLNPQLADAHFQLGLLFQRHALFEDALSRFRSALLINPRDARSHANLGLIFLMQGRFKEAAASFECAISLNPNLANAYDGLGVLAEIGGDTEKALTRFEQAINVKPDFGPAHFNRAVTLLRRGNMAQGLPALEWRWRLPYALFNTALRPFPQPRWKGEDLNGSKLLVWGEQGLGDEIRNSAMVNDLLERGHNVVLECEPRLKALFVRSFPAATIAERRVPPVKETKDKAIKFQSPLESLIQFVRPNLNNFQGRSSYLLADQLQTNKFRQDLTRSVRATRIVGLSWGSYNPQLQLGKTSALETWGPLLKLKMNQYVDLQYGDTGKDRAGIENKYSGVLLHLPELDIKNDIDGLAALISACDLVITVSNTTAHLAGALGVPTWVLLPFGHFQPWYWFSERTDSPWYPSVRLYRQQKFGDWANVIARVAEDLKALPISP